MYAVLAFQAITIAVLGVALGLGTVFVIEQFETPMAEIDLPPWLIVSGIVLNLLICMAASLIPFHRISRVDPITVLQG